MRAMQLSAEVRQVVDRVLADSTPGSAVAFDADGTLWSSDVGEEFLKHCEKEKLIKAGAWSQYEALLAKDPAEAFAFNAEVFDGISQSELAARGSTFFHREFVRRVFSFVTPLLSELTGAGFVPWVVSASPRLIVEAGAAFLQIPKTHVLAVQMGVNAGRITAPATRPIPCGEGKVTWLKKAKVHPVLAFGNSELDQPMLQYSRNAVVVAPTNGNNGLVKHAVTAGWAIQRAD